MSASGPVPDFLSHDAFLVFLWVSVGILTVTFAIRAYIRYVCFGRLLLEDWFMAGALAIYFPVAVLVHVFLPGFYNMVHAVNGTYVPGPTFLDDMAKSLRLAGVGVILTNIGLWLIKASFLVLFYRLGYQIRSYLYMWWVFTVIIVACGAANMALSDYVCVFADIKTIISTCSQKLSTQRVFVTEIAATILDIITDLLLIAFPIWILARTTLSLRQKIVFSAVFCLVGITVATTIVRGAFSKIIGLHPEDAVEEEIAWPFWFLVEYTTSFLVACAISFRSLFVQQRNKLSEAAEMGWRRQSPGTSREKGRTKHYLHKLHMSFLSTAHLLEGTAYGHETWHLPQPASGTMTVDFSKDEGWRPREEDGESMRALQPHGERNNTAEVTYSTV